MNKKRQTIPSKTQRELDDLTEKVMFGKMTERKAVYWITYLAVRDTFRNSILILSTWVMMFTIVIIFLWSIK